MLAKIKQEWAKWTQITPTDALYDRALIWLFLGLLMIGFVAVTSASIPISTSLFDDPFHFAQRDAIYVAIGIVTCTFFTFLPIKNIERSVATILLLSLFLLVIVLFIGTRVNGAIRWISFAGFNFQPAELAKLAVIGYFASFYANRYEEVRNNSWIIWKPTSVFALFIVLLNFQPDLGSTVVIGVLIFSMLVIAGAKLTQIIIVGVAGLICLAGAIFFVGFRARRALSFMNPFDDVYGDGFQLANSQMALGQGELWGQGLGNSIQKLGYLPEAHTDFIMAIIGEEFGFIGIMFMLALLILLTLRAIKISKESLLREQRFKGFFAFGVAMWIFFQGCVNLGAVSGLIPTKGLTFPFVSYGGSSLWIMSIAMGILLRIDHENRLDKFGHVVTNKNA